MARSLKKPTALKIRGTVKSPGAGSKHPAIAASPTSAEPATRPPSPAPATSSRVDPRPAAATSPVNRGISMRKPWGALSQTEIARLVSSSSLPLHGRLFLLALAHVNRSGHAEYGPGELRERLTTVDPRTGEVIGLPTASSIARAIQRAKQEGLLHEDSSASCLVLSTYLFEVGTGSGACRRHGIGRRIGARRRATSLPRADKPRPHGGKPGHS